MTTITIEYAVPRWQNINISTLPLKWQRWIEAWGLDEDDREDKDWDILESGSFGQLLEEVYGITPCSDVDVLNYT